MNPTTPDAWKPDAWGGAYVGAAVLEEVVAAGVAFAEGVHTELSDEDVGHYDDDFLKPWARSTGFLDGWERSLEKVPLLELWQPDLERWRTQPPYQRLLAAFQMDPFLASQVDTLIGATARKRFDLAGTFAPAALGPLALRTGLGPFDPAAVRATSSSWCRSTATRKSTRSSVCRLSVFRRLGRSACRMTMRSGS